MKKILIFFFFGWLNVLVGQCWQRAISTGGLNSLALKNDSTLFTWGHNNYGQLGDGTNIDKNVPTNITGVVKWKTISTNSGIKADGTLWTWGWNYFGQLGDGTNVDKNIPIQVGSGTNWASVFANGS